MSKEFVFRDERKLILQEGSLLFFLNISASALNYLCQLIMARILSVDSYGTINAVFSFMMIAAVPGSTLTMVVSKYCASNLGKNWKYLIRQIKAVIFFSIMIFFAFFLFGKMIKDIVSIDNHIIITMLFVISALGLWQPLFSGYFSGNKKFVLVGVYSMCIPIYKLVASALAYSFSKRDLMRVYIIIAVMIMGTLLTALLGYIVSRKISADQYDTSQLDEKLYTKKDIQVLFINFALMVYMNMDIFIVKHYCGENESGLYSSALLFGRIIYYVATTIGTMLLPIVAGETDIKERKKALCNALRAMSFFAISCIALVYLSRGFLITFLFGSSYSESSKYILIAMIISFSLSVCTIGANYSVGIGMVKIPMYIMLGSDMASIIFSLIFNNAYWVLIWIGVAGFIAGMAMIFACTNHRIANEV